MAISPTGPAGREQIALIMQEAADLCTNNEPPTQSLFIVYRQLLRSIGPGEPHLLLLALPVIMFVQKCYGVVDF